MFAVPFVMPCCAVLCYPCCAVLCRAMLCHAMSCCAVLCYAMLSLLYVLYCDCYVMLCYAMLSLPCFVQRKAMTPEDRRNNIIQLAHFAWNVSHLCYSVDRACLCCKLSRPSLSNANVQMNCAKQQLMRSCILCLHQFVASSTASSLLLTQLFEHTLFIATICEGPSFERHMIATAFIIPLLPL